MVISHDQPLYAGLEYHILAQIPSSGTWITYLNGGNRDQAMHCIALALVDFGPDAIRVEAYDPSASPGGCGRGG